MVRAKKGGVNMAIKSSNVAARVEPELKEQAEMILSNLGIPASTAINMFYRQIVLWNGLPFRPCMPANYPKSRSEMTDDEFNAKMAIGYAQAQTDQSAPTDTLDNTVRCEVKIIPCNFVFIILRHLTPP